MRVSSEPGRVGVDLSGEGHLAVCPSFLLYYESPDMYNVQLIPSMHPYHFQVLEVQLMHCNLELYLSM